MDRAAEHLAIHNTTRPPLDWTADPLTIHDPTRPPLDWTGGHPAIYNGTRAAMDGAGEQLHHRHCPVGPGAPGLPVDHLGAPRLPAALGRWSRQE